MGTTLFLEEPVSAGRGADTRREAVELRPARLLFCWSIPPDPSLSPHVFGAIIQVPVPCCHAEEDLEGFWTSPRARQDQRGPWGRSDAWRCRRTEGGSCGKCRVLWLRWLFVILPRSDRSWPESPLLFPPRCASRKWWMRRRGPFPVSCRGRSASFLDVFCSGEGKRAFLLPEPSSLQTWLQPGQWRVREKIGRNLKAHVAQLEEELF